MTTRIASTLLAAIVLIPCAAQAQDDTDPINAWHFDLESSVLWNVGGNTNIDYVLLPQYFSFRSPHMLQWEMPDGDLVVRNRFHGIAQGFARGPEDYYFGLAAAPSLEYWNTARTTALTFAIGGGFGWLNSAGPNVRGAQGQDFTLNWFSQLMLRHELRENLSLSAGVTFQHLSNGGATDPNPGIDGLGPTLGLTWRF